jgi:uncharacterized membrane protein
MRKFNWFLIIAAVVFFATGALFYPYLPAQVASHWNAAGQVNGYLPRGWGVFVFPIVFVLIALIFSIIPYIDPRRENIAKFRRVYNWFVAAIALFLYYTYLLLLLPSVGYSIDIIKALIPAYAALIYISGTFLPYTHPNWFIGIRTPWTISSETVWRKTHKLGGVLFRVSAVIALIGAFSPLAISLWFLIAPLIASAITCIVYSYVVWAGEKK